MSFLMLCVVFCTSIQANISSGHPKLDLADQFYEKRGDMENAKKALELYEEVAKKEPKNVEALWRAAMGTYYIGHLVERPRTKKEYFKKGIRYAKDCVKYSPKDRVECYFWLATNSVLLKKESGILSLAFGLGGIFDLYHKAQSIDPNYAHGGPDRMLGLLYYKAPSFLGGDEKKGFEHIDQSIEKAPMEPLNYYTKITFLDKEGKKEEAIKVADLYKSRIGDVNTFSYYESEKAHSKIFYYLEHKKLLK